MKSRNLKWLKTLLAVLIALSAIIGLGIEREQRSPNQKINQYRAVRQLDIWKFYGKEIYAENHLAVYDMDGRTTKDLPPPIGMITTQVRKFGEIVEGDSQFNLGESQYDSDGCIDYIYWNLGSSPHSQYRIEAVSVFRRKLEYYPLTAALKNDLLKDSDDRIQQEMVKVLSHQH